MHPRNPGYQPGNYWMVCDVCGIDYRSDQMRPRWDGLHTCQKDWEPRHPQDFLRGVPDDQSVPVSRPPPEMVYIAANSVTAEDL